MKEYRIAVVGATGLVGQEALRILEQRKFPMSTIQLFNSNSTKKKVAVRGTQVEIKEVTADALQAIDMVFFFSGIDVSRHFAPVAARSGAVVIDTSPEFRMSQEIPLVIPEVNLVDARMHKGIISCPGASTVPIAIALYPLHKVNPIQRIIVDTCQSVSGMGAAAIDELTVQSRQVLEAKPTVPHIFPHQIAFNLFPHIDLFLENGYTREENHIIYKRDQKNYACS